MALMLTKNGLRAFSTMQHQEFSLRQRMTGGPLSHHKSIEIQSKETYFFMLQWIFHLHFGQGACVLLRPPEQKQLDRSDGDGAGPGKRFRQLFWLFQLFGLSKLRLGRTQFFDGLCLDLALLSLRLLQYQQMRP